MRDLMTAMSVLSLAIGCGTDGGTDGDSDSSVFAPKEGDWEVGTTVADNGCGPEMGMSDDTGSAPEIINLTMDNDGTGFTILDEDAATTYCALNGKNFVCDLTDDASSDMSLEEFGMDATIHWEMAITGLFSSETKGSVVYELGMSCDGENCDVVEEEYQTSLPCTASAEAPLTAL